MAAAINYPLVEPVVDGQGNLDSFKFINQVIAAITPDEMKKTNVEIVSYEEDTTTDGMLVENPDTNTKKYRQGATYARLSSTAEGNMCWLASFLTAVSDTYNVHTLKDQITLTRAFRTYCLQHVDEIKAAFPKQMAESSIYSTAVAELKGTLETENKELARLEGFIIAWYFGFNNVFLVVNNEGTEVAPDAATAYQSPECPVVFIYYMPLSQDDLGHYEVLGIKKEAATLEFDTHFEWSDKRLCDLKATFQLCDKGFLNDPNVASWLCEWELPECEGTPNAKPFPTFNGADANNNGSSTGSTNSNMFNNSNAESNNSSVSFESNSEGEPEPNQPETEPNVPGGENLRKLYGNNKNNFEEEPTPKKNGPKNGPKESVNNFVAPGETPEGFYNNNGNATPKGNNGKKNGPKNSVNNFVAPGETPEGFYNNENGNGNGTNKNKQVFVLKEIKGLKPAEKDELLEFLNPKGMPKLTIDSTVSNLLRRGRKISRTLHPNKGGDEDKFKRFRELLNLLASLQSSNLKFLENGSVTETLNEPIANVEPLKKTLQNENNNRVAYAPQMTRKNKGKNKGKGANNGKKKLSKEDVQDLIDSLEPIKPKLNLVENTIPEAEKKLNLLITKLEDVKAKTPEPTPKDIEDIFDEEGLGDDMRRILQQTNFQAKGVFEKVPELKNIFRSSTIGLAGSTGVRPSANQYKANKGNTAKAARKTRRKNRKGRK
jgi:hypothetical protein